MIIRLSEQKLELKNGNEITRGHDSVFTKSESLKGYLKYLYGPKESGNESIAPAVRVRYNDNNAHHLSSPEYFLEHRFLKRGLMPIRLKQRQFGSIHSISFRSSRNVERTEKRRSKIRFYKS